MKLYFNKSGQITGFSRDKVKLPGNSIIIPDNELPDDFRKVSLSGKYKVVGKKLKKGRAPTDPAKHLETLTTSIDESLRIQLSSDEKERKPRPKKSPIKKTK